MGRPCALPRRVSILPHPRRDAADRSRAALLPEDSRAQIAKLPAATPLLPQTDSSATISVRSNAALRGWPARTLPPPRARRAPLSGLHADGRARPDGRVPADDADWF